MLRLMKLLCLLFALAVALPAPAAAAPPAEIVSILNQPYVAKGHPRQKLDLYLPPDLDSPAPLLLWIHGGGWREGDKADCPALPIVAQGWIVASINYRLSQHAAFPAQLEDCKAALRFLRANAAQYRIDPQRTVVWGASAGGHLAALLGVTGETREFDVGAHLEQSSRVSCVINWFGPADLRHWEAETEQLAALRDEVLGQLLGGPVEDKKELAAKGSPVTWVGKHCAPMLIMHGDDDKLVPLRQNKEFAAALREAGVPCILQIYPGQGHGGPRFTDDAAVNLMIGFVEKHAAAPKPVPAAGSAPGKAGDS